MLTRTLSLTMITAALALTSACGDDTSTEGNRAPAPVAPDENDDSGIFALESGTYYVSELHDLNDGCGKKPLADGDALYQRPFTLANDGKGNVSLSFCSYEGTQTAGSVTGNRGELSVIHSDRTQGAGKFDQECIMNVEVTAHSKMLVHYTENQRNRNLAAQEATGINKTECTTSFVMTIEKR